MSQERGFLIIRRYPIRGRLSNRSSIIIVGIETQQDYKLGVYLKGVAADERSSNEDADIAATHRGVNPSGFKGYTIKCKRGEKGVKSSRKISAFLTAFPLHFRYSRFFRHEIDYTYSQLGVGKSNGT